MAKIEFNPNDYEAKFEMGGGLPVGKHPLEVTGTDIKPTKDQSGGYLEVNLTAFDGPAKGASGKLRFNLYNQSEAAIRIARQQFSAFCVCLGINSTLTDTEMLHGKRLIGVVDWQNNEQKYTEIKEIFDMNGASAEQIRNNNTQTNNGGGNSNAQWGGNQQAQDNNSGGQPWGGSTNASSADNSATDNGGNQPWGGNGNSNSTPWG